MNSEDIAIVAAAVVALTQLLKWIGLVRSDSALAPLAVLVLAALGVVLWGVSNEVELTRRMIWPYFSAWIVVGTSAAGVYGFTRESPAAVTSLRKGA